MAIIIGTDPQVVIASNDKPVFVHTGGAQGAQGIQGVKGDKGDKGDSGDTGNFTGLAGFTDANGFTGNITNNNLSLTLQDANATLSGQLTSSAFNAFSGAVSNVTELQNQTATLSGNLNATNVMLIETTNNTTSLATTKLNITDALVLGSTNLTAYRGDLGVATEGNVTALQNLTTTLSSDANTTNSILNGATSNITTLQGNVSALINHTTNTSNPHGVTKAQIGLPNVTDVTPLELPTSNATQTALNDKQGTLISGTNIKTINGNSILGSGDMTITGGGNISGIAGFTDGNGFTGNVSGNYLSLTLQNANATQSGQVTAGKYTDWESKGTSNLTLGSTGTTALKGNATTADVAASTDKNYVTNAKLAVLNQTSGTNSGDQDLSGLVAKSTTVNGANLSSNITLTTANITVSTDKNYITDAKLSVINATSGTNTGDQNLSGYVQSTRTINGADLSANITLTTANISASTDKQYVTDAKLAVINVTSGTNTGDQTITLSGDVSGSGTANITATLATVNNNAGVFGNATTVPIITVNGKGIVTNITNVTISNGSGTVTNVTATAPVVSSGGTAPNISMAAATSSVDGYMTNTYAGKLDSIAANSNVTYVQGNGTVNGLTLTGNVTGGGNLTLGGTLSGTAASLTAGNVTNIPALSGAITGNSTGTTTLTANGTTSAQLAAALTDETGTGSAVFGTNCTLNTPNLTTPSAINLTNAVSLSLTAGVSGILPVANGGVEQASWTSYTPTLVNITLGNGTLSCAYQMITKKTAAVRFQLTAGTTTSLAAGVQPTFSLPFLGVSSLILRSVLGDLCFYDTSTTIPYAGNALLETNSGSSTAGLYIGYSGFTYDTLGALNNGVPVAIATGDVISATFIYEIA